MSPLLLGMFEVGFGRWLRGCYEVGFGKKEDVTSPPTAGPQPLKLSRSDRNKGGANINPPSQFFCFLHALLRAESPCEVGQRTGQGV